MWTTTLCEVCQKNEMNVVEGADEPKQAFQLCQQCYERLLTDSLRPIEWYNLAVLLSPKQFLLHDDFYGEDGQAFQLEEEVIDALKQHDQQKILASIKSRFNETEHAEVKSRMIRNRG